jgi:hypothetical protein
MLVKYGYNRKKVILPESTTQLALEQEAKESSKIEELAKSSKRIASLMGEGTESEFQSAQFSNNSSTFKSAKGTLQETGSNSSNPGASSKLSSSSKTVSLQQRDPINQIESKTKSGKKRITPQFLGRCEIVNRIVKYIILIFSFSVGASLTSPTLMLQSPPSLNPNESNVLHLKFFYCR